MKVYRVGMRQLHRLGLCTRSCQICRAKRQHGEGRCMPRCWVCEVVKKRKAHG